MKNERILAKNVRVSNNTRATQLNNNDIIVGASGCGKTTGYVIPNIQQYNGSMVIADTKGNLHKKLRAGLEAAGYEVQVIDFVNMEKSASYNPFDYIGKGKSAGGFREQDIITIAKAMAPDTTKDDPFWNDAARSVLACLIAFVMEALPKKERNLCSATKLFHCLDTNQGKQIFRELEEVLPDSFAVRKYKGFSKIFKTEKTWNCIAQFVNEALELYDLTEAQGMFNKRVAFRLEDLGKKKMAVFVNVSDTDRAFDRLINVFYAQLFQQLIKTADGNEDGRLQVPVRIILDDFATNVYIPDFDKLISVIRSREISVSIILQSISQLETLYTHAQAVTIINGCDHLLYLGGQDVSTAEYISKKANVLVENVLNMRLDDAFLFTRGEQPAQVEKVNPFQGAEPEA